MQAVNRIKCSLAGKPLKASDEALVSVTRMYLLGNLTKEIIRPVSSLS